jgi:uncharacterized protein (DUF1015 family)
MEFHLGGRRRRVRGVIVEVGLEPWGGRIIPHERTMPGPIEDRMTLLRAMRANLSPVFAVLRGPSPTLASFLDAATGRTPDRRVADEAGTVHRLWVLGSDAEEVTREIARHPLMIADGHHRYTVALRYREEMRSRHGPGPWDAMMMLVVDAATEDPPVLPIHRLLTGPAPVPHGPLAGDRVRDLAEVLASLRDEDLTYGVIHREDDLVVHRLGSLEGSPPTVCALHERILDRIPPGSIRFVSDAAKAEAAVASGHATLAYLLPPTRVERVWDVVRAGRMLPPKSTYFWPKPRTGMVIRPLEP